MQAPPLLVAFDLLGTFAFGMGGALVAVRAARVDLLGALVLGLITAIGGGVVRDLIIGAIPPATFSDWRYLTAAFSGALIAFCWSRLLMRFSMSIEVLDAIGLGVFCVVGASKALSFGLGVVQATLLGMLSAVGGGVLRDAVLSKLPAVLISGMYAVAPLIGGMLTVLFSRFDVHGPVAMFAAAGVCFVVRMLGLKFDLKLPVSREHRPADPPPRIPSPLDDMPTVQLPVVRHKSTIPRSVPRDPWMDAPTLRRPRKIR